MDADAVDLYVFIGADHDVFDAADDPGLDQVTSGGVYLDGDIRGFDFKTLVVNDVLGVQVRFKAEGLIVIHAELGQMLLRHPAGGQGFLYIGLGDHQRFRHLGLFVQLNALAQLVVDRLHHIQAALLPQGRGEQGLKALFLLVGRHGDRGIEQGLDQGILAGFDVVGVVQSVINIGGPVVKGREQEAQNGGGHRLIHGAVVEELFLGNIVQIGLGLLHGANGANEVGIHLLGFIGIGQIILSLKGHIIAVTAQQNQVISLHGHGVNDFLEEGMEQLIVFEFGFPQVHQ